MPGIQGNEAAAEEVLNRAMQTFHLTIGVGGVGAAPLLLDAQGGAVGGEGPSKLGAIVMAHSLRRAEDRNHAFLESSCGGSSRAVAEQHQYAELTKAADGHKKLPHRTPRHTKVDYAVQSPYQARPCWEWQK